MDRLYFDHSATTPMCRQSLDAYIEAVTAHGGNPSSRHAVGADAKKMLEAARGNLLASLGARQSDGTVIFTGSGTEANNLAVFGRVTAKARYKGARVIASDGEHASVFASLARLSELGYDVVLLKTRDGKIDENELAEALNDRTVLVSVMHGSNESGALYDIARLARITHERARDALFHTDATQSYLRVPISVREMGVDMLTVSSHKIEGPKGVGALYVSQSVLKSKGLAPLVCGGGQEQGLRSGTENAPAIHAFSAAVTAYKAEMEKRAAHMAHLRSYLIDLLAGSEIKPLLPQSHLPHILTLTLPRIKSEVALNALSRKGISVSAGSACSSHGVHGTHPLLAYGLTPAEVDCTLRVSLSYRHTEEDAEALAGALRELCKHLVRMR